MTLVEDCYRFSQDFPREELYGLISQIRRAAVSVPANMNFLRNSEGSLKELETHLILAQRLQFGNFERAEQLLTRCEAIVRMLVVLVRSLRSAEEH